MAGTHCTFALCPACAEHPIGDPFSPTLPPCFLPPACNVCLETEGPQLCSLHFPPDYLCCEICLEARCFDHMWVDEPSSSPSSGRLPGFVFCGQCGYSICGKDVCLDAHARRGLRLCWGPGGCGYIKCSACQPRMWCDNCGQPTICR